MNNKPLHQLPFFFILSMGRSGSTLMQFLLDAHCGVNIPFESRFIIHLYYKYHNITNWTTELKRDFIEDLYKDDKLRKFWNIDKNKLYKDIMEHPSSTSFFNLCRIVTKNSISIFDKEVICVQGSKNPNYCFWVDKLIKLDENIKFIHLVRNPLGVVNSHKKLNSNNPSYFAYRWKKMNKLIEKIKSRNSSKFLTIRYEDLLAEPNQTLQKVCTFLGINFNEHQLSYYQKIIEFDKSIDDKTDPIKRKLFDSHLKNLTLPISSKIGNSWKNNLTSNEKAIVGSITHQLANQYGYKPIKGKFKLYYLFSCLKVNYKYLKNRLYYRLSMSLK